MDLIERQRELLEASGFVIPGNVYKIHYTILKFGHPESPTHFTTNVTEMLQNIRAVTVIPISTKRYRTKNIVPLNLSTDSTVKAYEDEILDQQSFAILALPKQIKVEQLFEEPSTHLRGALKEPKTKELLEARKNFIKYQFKKHGRP
jgi:hypothetical protein